MKRRDLRLSRLGIHFVRFRFGSRRLFSRAAFLSFLRWTTCPPWAWAGQWRFADQGVFVATSHRRPRQRITKYGGRERFSGHILHARSSAERLWKTHTPYRLPLAGTICQAVSAPPLTVSPGKGCGPLWQRGALGWGLAPQVPVLFQANGDRHVARRASPHLLARNLAAPCGSPFDKHDRLAYSWVTRRRATPVPS